MSEISVKVTDEKVRVGIHNPFIATITYVGDERFAQGRTGTLYRECYKCRDFAGRLPEYLGIYEGECFACNGRGFSAKVESEAKAISLAKRRITDRARVERKRAEKEAAQRVARDEWAAAHPEVAAAAAEVMADAPEWDNHQNMTDAHYAANEAWTEKWGGFVTGLAQQATYRALSEKQTEAFLPAFEQAKADRAEAVEVASKQRYLDVAEGAKKVTVTGQITVAATFEGVSFTGFPENKRIVIVEGEGDDEGVTVKMMGGAQALWDAEKGQRVEVTGTVKGFEEYEGVPQTVFIRPKFRVLAEADQ